jgi:hypothetical protein
MNDMAISRRTLLRGAPLGTLGAGGVFDYQAPASSLTVVTGPRVLTYSHIGI